MILINKEGEIELKDYLDDPKILRNMTNNSVSTELISLMKDDELMRLFGRIDTEFDIGKVVVEQDRHTRKINRKITYNELNAFLWEIRDAIAQTLGYDDYEEMKNDNERNK